MLLITLNEKMNEKRLLLRVIIGAASILLGFVFGLLTMVDYLHAGVLTVLAFYFFRHRKWWCFVGQFISLWYINFELLAGLEYELSLFGRQLLFPRQGFALLALLPIWLYQGRLGYHSKAFRNFCYAFYPLHLLLLGLLRYI